MKRFIVCLLASVIALSLGFSFVSLAEEIELHTIVGPHHIAYYMQRAALFEKETGIHVTFSVVPYGRDIVPKLIASMLAGGHQYDMWIIDCVDVPKFADAGWVLPVDQWLTNDLRQDAVPFALEGMAYNGHWYGLPTVSEWKSFVYNKKMLEQVGYSNPPKTWDEFVTIAKKLQDAGIVKYASAWSWAQKECLTCDFVAILASFGGKFFDKDLNPVFNDEKGVQALQFMVDMLYKYKIADPASLGWTEDDVYKATYNGDIAFAMRWGIPLVELDDPAKSRTVGQWEIGLMPSVDGEHPYTVAGPMGWAISYGSRHPKEAFEFIKFITGPKGALDEALKEGIVPGWKSVWNNPEFLKKARGLDEMAKQAMYVVNRPRVPWYLEFSSKLQLELHKALIREITPKEALDAAAQAAIQIKANYENSKSQ